MGLQSDCGLGRRKNEKITLNELVYRRISVRPLVSPERPLCISVGAETPGLCLGLPEPLPSLSTVRSFSVCAWDWTSCVGQTGL